MIDVNPEIISRTLQSVWYSDTLEHYQEEEEYYALDFTNEADVRYAIRKWLTGGPGWRNKTEETLYKESLRYAITKNGCLHANIFLPKIDDETETSDEYRKDLNQWKALYKNFLLILWDEWFYEPFVPADLSQYKIRKDVEFVNFPHMPELWKEPVYEGEFLEKNDDISVSNPVVEIKPKSKIKKIVLILGLILIGLGIAVFFKYFFKR